MEDDDEGVGFRKGRMKKKSVFSQALNISLSFFLLISQECVKWEEMKKIYLYIWVCYPHGISERVGEVNLFSYFVL